MAVLPEDHNKKIVSALNRMFFASYYCDLKDQTFVTIQCTKHSMKMLENSHTLPEAFKRFIEVLVKPEDAKTMAEFCNLDTLAARLKNESYISYDYDSKLEDGWRQVGFLPVDYDENHEVSHVLFVVLDLDANKSKRKKDDREIQNMIRIQQKAAQLVSASEILAVAIIDKESGLTQINTSFPEIDSDKEYTLQECSQKEAEFVASIDCKFFEENSVLSKIGKQVEKYGYYQFAISILDQDDNYHYVVHHYTELGDGKHILSVVEDVTNQISMDAVTGLINRTGFSKRARIYIESTLDIEFVVLCFNIEKFKAINSWYGFENGDRVLKEVAERIRTSAIRPILTSRENADVFFCLIRKDDMDLNEINRICCPHTCVNEIQIPVSLNCGICIINHKEEVRAICDKARLACNKCSGESESRYKMYDYRMKSDYLEQVYILQNVSSAIEKKQFVVYYQPIYNAKTKKIVSAEALVRWQHPEYGLISPAAFLPVIEQNGRISELDKYVGQCVWKMQERRKREKKHLVPVAVNMSRYDFLKIKSLKEILEMIQSQPQMCEMLRLEVTESGFANINEEGKKILEQLHKLGCKVLVDDFGSGYSSLGMLAAFDCDLIKMDMSFANSIGKNYRAEILISATIQVSHEMGIEVVAEGVETKEQYEFFRDHGCDYIQGYYFSQPVSREEYEDLLEKEEKS